VDKHRPISLDKLDIHQSLSRNLKKMCNSENLSVPHLLFYGPSGAGKKTRIMAVLREMYGSGVEKLKVEHRSMKIKSKNVELVTIASNYHIEMNPSDAGFYDRVIVQEVIKEIAQSHPIDTHRTFKVVVLNEVDKLSKDAQHALRRTMEKYMATCRLILCCSSTSKVIEPVRSRCLVIRVPAPSIQEIVQVLQSVARKEKLSLPSELASKIALLSERNLRKAVLMLEAAKVKQYPFQPQQEIDKADWEEYVLSIAKDITDEQTPKKLLAVRSKLYELLTHCIPPDLIIKNLTFALLGKIDSELKFQVVKWAAFFEHRIQTGSKAIFHLEAFVAKFMSIYKRFLVKIESDFS